MGYKTFDKWINHSYDNEQDDTTRLKMVLTEFDRLQNISKQQWADMLYEMRQDLMYNLGQVSTTEPHNPMIELTPVMIDFFK
jgi:hypothetical protein